MGPIIILFIDINLNGENYSEMANKLCMIHEVEKSMLIKTIFKKTSTVNIYFGC